MKTIHEAAENGDIGAVQSFLDSGTDVNARDRNGWTALLWASYWDYSELVEFLLSKGADIEAKDYEDNSALDWAAYRGRNKIVEILLARGATVSEQALRNARRPFAYCVMSDHVTQEIQKKIARMIKQHAHKARANKGENPP